MSEIQKIHRKLCQDLETNFTKEFLQKFYLPILKSVLAQDEALFRKVDYGKFIPDNIKELSTKSKKEIIEAIALLFVGIDPYRKFRQVLTEDARVLWDALVFNEMIGFEQAAYEYGIVVSESKTRNFAYYQSPDVKPPFELLPRKTASWSSYFADRLFFYLPRGLRELLIEYYEYPDWAKLTPMEALPEGLVPFSNTEQQFFLDYSRLKIYFQQGEIKYSAKNRPLATGLAKVQKMAQIGEFFPDTTIKRHKLVRTNILAGIMPYLEFMTKKSPEPHVMLRNFFTQIYPSRVPTPPLLLPDIKGLANIENEYFISYEKEMFSLLRALPAGQYVSATNLLGHCKYKLIEAAAISRILACEKLSLEGSLDAEHLTRISLGTYKQAIQLPLIRGSFFLFAALGLCELVYEKVEDEDFGHTKFSPWDGLVAVKRTPLGDYVCGLTDQYAVSDQKNAGFSLSDKALLIQLDKADSRIAGSLGVFAEQTSPLAFKTDARLFLRNINRKEELTAKIELFKQMAPANIPKNWKDFFNSLYEKIDPLSLYGDCIIFSVARTNQELIRLLAQDPVIKTLILKAEGYLIIVPKKNYAALRRRLAEFGYLQT